RLREQLRARRSALTQSEASAAALACAQHLTSSSEFKTAGHIAGYVSVDRELDPQPLLRMALEEAKSVYLPRIRESNGMEFVAWRAGDPLHGNRFGIPEPSSRDAAVFAPEALDLVLVPLLGFDMRGNRLGFGGGFYDRAFAFRRLRSAPPFLCGYAYDGQRCDGLEAAEWDVALDAIVTPSGVHFFSG
ncbi:MAG TPA: 5-formyltetrahydrofolate cyclo-ligase, partial [Verrucomicrobiae bacterium]|nr:5-formyltetrahydrofolate cyclo-ligase [Verrucomicrobiae bacterium]